MDEDIKMTCNSTINMEVNEMEGAEIYKMAKKNTKNEKVSPESWTNEAHGKNKTSSPIRPGITLNIKNLHLHFDKCLRTAAFVIAAVAAVVRSMMS